MDAKSLTLALALIALSACVTTCSASATQYIEKDLAKANETLNHASDLYKKAADRGQLERFGTCIEEYRAVISRNLPNAKAAVKVGGIPGYSRAVSELEATQQHADNCESQFAPPLVSPFTAETKAVKDLAQDAIDSIKNL